jgi:hypothetical protein
MAKLSGFMLALTTRLEKKSVSDAIARTTQCLAHDVRKPLSMVEMILENASEMDSGDEAKHFIQDALPEIRQAKASVEGLIKKMEQALA